MVCLSPSWFDMQEHVLRMRTFQNEANYLQKSWCCKLGYNKCRLKSSYDFANFTVVIMTLFAITNYHWPICWMICFIQLVRLSFPYWLWRWVIPYTLFRLRVHGGCDRSAEDAYSSAAPDPTFTFVGDPCCSTLNFVITFWIMITFYTLLTSLFCILNHQTCISDCWWTTCPQGYLSLGIYSNVRIWKINEEILAGTSPSVQRCHSDECTGMGSNYR
jgi:hypothetical protein